MKEKYIFQTRSVVLLAYNGIKRTLENGFKEVSNIDYNNDLICDTNYGKTIMKIYEFDPSQMSREEALNNIQKTKLVWSRE